MRSGLARLALVAALPADFRVELLREVARRAAEIERRHAERDLGRWADDGGAA